MPVLFGGHNLTPLVEIGLTDLLKYGGAMGATVYIVGQYTLSLSYVVVH